MEVYTFSSNPFRMGGPQHDIIKTKVEEYSRVHIGRGYYAIIFKNEIRNLWHFVLENCGALIFTDKNKDNGLKTVRQDVETGDPKLMEQQIKQGKSDCASATLIDFDDFCRRFKNG